MDVLNVIDQEDGGAVVEFDLSTEEANAAYEVGKYLLPDEKDFERFK